MGGWVQTPQVGGRVWASQMRVKHSVLSANTGKTSTSASSAAGGSVHGHAATEPGVHMSTAVIIDLIS